MENPDQVTNYLYKFSQIDKFKFQIVNTFTFVSEKTFEAAEWYFLSMVKEVY